MAAEPALKYISIEEYLEMEEASGEKHEYYQGEVFGMAGALYSTTGLLAIQ